MFNIKVKRTTHRDTSKIAQGFKRPRAVKVGFVAGQTDTENLNKAVWNEYGTSRGIPERPFMRNAIHDNRAKYLRQMKAGAKLILGGHNTVRNVLNKLGIQVVADIQGEIVALSSPPNAASTAAKKGSSNPLIDTGAMHGSVSHKLDD